MNVDNPNGGIRFATPQETFAIADHRFAGTNTFADRLNSDLDLIELAGTIWRGKVLILLFAGLAALASFVLVSAALRSSYSATTQIVLLDRENNPI